MAHATPTGTPNPNATKFVLDTTLPEMFNVTSPAEAATPFAVAVMALPGVISVFGVNDFVTVTKSPDASWADITDAVVAIAEEHL
jgi:Scaffold protein Nfu/NifU N terminal